MIFWNSIADAVFRLDFSEWHLIHRFFVKPFFLFGLMVSGIQATTSFAGQHWGWLNMTGIVGFSIGSLCWLILIGFIVFVYREWLQRLNHCETKMLEIELKQPDVDFSRIKRSINLFRGTLTGIPTAGVRALAIDGISSQAWRDPDSVPWVKQFENNFEIIRSEIVNVYSSNKDQIEGYKFTGIASGDFQSIRIMNPQKGFIEKARQLLPQTVGLIEKHVGKNCREILVSILGPGARLSSHRDTGNAFWTFHMGIIVPENCGIRVGGETRTWIPGKPMIFDTSYSHEAWNLSNEARIVLIIDFPHPELTPQEQEIVNQF
jgi:beta-hydroxylase